MARRNRNITYIHDDIKRRNTKCKRSKNLMKKCYELSQLCDLDINISIYDKNRNRLQEFCSSTYFTSSFVSSLTKQASMKSSKNGSRQNKFNYTRLIGREFKNVNKVELQEGELIDEQQDDQSDSSSEMPRKKQKVQETEDTVTHVSQTNSKKGASLFTKDQQKP